MRLKWTNRFTKTYRRIRQSGQANIRGTLENVMSLLTENDEHARELLTKQYRDHLLKGDKKGLRELHLAQDFLLVYRIDHMEEMITLLNIITHEQLRKRAW